MESTAAASASIRDLQQMLDYLAAHRPALPRLKPTGIFDEPTLEAVMIFQRDSGLPVTGKVDHDTWYAVTAAYREDLMKYGPPAPLQVLPHGEFSAAPEQSGEQIAIAQAMLCSLSKRVANFSPCQADQTNGGGTQADLRTLQALAGIPVTGALDRLTWEYLTRLYHLFITRNVRLQLEKS